MALKRLPREERHERMAEHFDYQMSGLKQRLANKMLWSVGNDARPLESDEHSVRT